MYRREHFYFGKNAGLFMLVSVRLHKSLSRSNRAKRFSVRGLCCALFYLGAKDMSEPFTFHRSIDKMGRIVIPRDLRQAVGLTAGDGVTIRITEEGILLCPDKKEKK